MSTPLNEDQFPVRVDHNDNGRVYVGDKSIGHVRRDTTLESVHSVGRHWVGVDRNKKTRTPAHDTAQAAAERLADVTGFRR